MLEYTGHPLVDVGVATITAFAGKENPKKLTEDDLQSITKYMAYEYVRQPLKSFLTVAFTSNAWFCQDAYNPNKLGLSKEQRAERQEKRDKWEKHHLRQWASPETSTTEYDIFTKEPAINVELSGTLAPGKAGRAQIPLVLGDNYINFFPNGNSGLLISGKTLLCLQSFPLGCAKCGGRLLVVHSDNKELMLHFAKEFLQKNRQAIQLVQKDGGTKLPEATYSYRTLLIDTLLPADIMRREAKQNERAFSITAYHFTNSGQGVDLNIYRLPMEILSFLGLMETATYNQQWHAIVNRAWEVEPQKKRKKKDDKPWKPRRNWLYEDLFDLPEQAAKFIRTYFLRVALRYAKNRDTDPRDSYSIRQDAELVSWEITSKFLERIMHMDKERIEKIKQMGDTLANYVNHQNDRRFFREFYITSRYDYFRNTLVKANLAYTKQGHAPLITFDSFITIFEDGENLARIDWKLARDLVLIRMVEQLYELKWLGKNVDVLPDTNKEIETDQA